jgi:hypothetical protein
MMTRDEFIWVTVRAIGAMTLWLLIYNLFGFLIYLPIAILSIHSFGRDYTSFRAELFVASCRACMEIIIYGGLSYYLIRRWRMIFNLINKNLP